MYNLPHCLLSAPLLQSHSSPPALSNCIAVSPPHSLTIQQPSCPVPHYIIPVCLFIHLCLYSSLPNCPTSCPALAHYLSALRPLHHLTQSLTVPLSNCLLFNHLAVPQRLSFSHWPSVPLPHCSIDSIPTVPLRFSFPLFPVSLVTLPLSHCHTFSPKSRRLSLTERPIGWYHFQPNKSRWTVPLNCFLSGVRNMATALHFCSVRETSFIKLQHPLLWRTQSSFFFVTCGRFWLKQHSSSGPPPVPPASVLAPLRAWSRREEIPRELSLRGTRTPISQRPLGSEIGSSSNLASPDRPSPSWHRELSYGICLTDLWLYILIYKRSETSLEKTIVKSRSQFLCLLR